MNNMRFSLNIRKYQTVKYSTLSFVVIFSFLWILAGFNTGNADSSQYVAMYDAAAQGNFYYAEKGFLLICMFFSKIGFAYQEFLIIYCFVALFLMSKFIINNTTKPAFVFVLYGLFPFLFDAVQIRNLMVEAIFLFSLRFLEDFKVKNVLLYVLFTCLAATQHSIAVINFIFLLAYIKKTKLVAFISMFIGITFVISSRTILPMLMDFVVSSRFNYSLIDPNVALSTIIKYILFEMVIIILALLTLHKQRIKMYNYPDINRRTTFLIRIIVITVAFVPLIAVNGDYFRAFRNCLIIYYCVISNKYNQVIFTEGVVFELCMVACVLVACFFNFSPGIYFYDTVTYPIFHNNLLW